MTHPRGALHGVRIIEIRSLVSAYGGKLLADMGADVIRVDPPFTELDADPTSDLGSDLLYYEANKRSIVLDLQSPNGREAFHGLIGGADVLIDGDPALDLDHGALRARHPGLIAAILTPFGKSGPWRHYRGNDLVCQAAGGMIAPNGERTRPPLPAAGLQAYHAAAIHAALAIMLALLARQRSGEGQEIDISIQDCVAACVEHATSRFFADGGVTQRSGTLHESRCFRQIRCRDGYALVSTLGDWTALVEWVNGDGKADDLVLPAWRDPTYRRRHAEHLFAVLEHWAEGYTVADLVDAAQLRRLPFAPVQPPAAVLHHPQLCARRFFVRAGEATADSEPTAHEPGAPYLFSRTPWSRRRPPPYPGQHTDEILAELTHTVPLRSACAPAAGPVRGALDGLRVIDFTWVVGGPVATRFLADHGAEVIKIERVDAALGTSRRSGLEASLNRGKKSIALNLDDERGLQIVKQLIGSADVVIDNFSPRVMQAWGLGYDGLRQLRADIIAVSMSGFGETGPWRDHVSYGPTLQALAGFSDLMRHPDDAPTGWGFSYSDMIAGWMAALATLFAVWHRQQSGEGQHIDLSQLECLVALLGPQLRQASLPPRRGATPATTTAFDIRSPEMPSAPHGIYGCADRHEGKIAERWCAISVSNEAEWRRFVAALGAPPWAADDRFSTLADRLRNRADLDARVEGWTRRRSAEDIMTHLQKHGVSAAVVADAQDLCATGSHRQSRRAFASIATPDGSSARMDRSPIRLSRTPGEIASPAPFVGEHTDAVLMQFLGLRPTEIAVLRQGKAVA